MDEAHFHELADASLEELENMLIEADDGGALDVELTEGILTIALPDGEEFVINKHEPTCQLWYASPVSGAGRFAYDKEEGTWLNTNDDRQLYEMFADELNALISIVLEV